MRIPRGGSISGGIPVGRGTEEGGGNRLGVVDKRENTGGEGHRERRWIPKGGRVDQRDNTGGEGHRGRRWMPAGVR